MQVHFRILGHLALLVLLSTSLFGQTTATRMFIFGHSLVDHRPPLIPTPSDETTVPHWLHLLAQAAGYDYQAGGQYGFLPQHANLPPISQWGYDLVPPVWESDEEPFAEADINTVLITAGNFMQWQAPTEDYPGNPGLSPVSATLAILDWLVDQGDAPKCYIYENWPDMAPYLSNGFPPSAAEFAQYNDDTQADFHAWWIDYQDMLLAQRPDVNVRMIPAGPIISKLHNELFPQLIPITELYEDDAPHGRATTYFLAALVTHMAIYESPAPMDYDVPSIVHATIRDNYATIVDFIWAELQAFNQENGESRVFFGLVSNTATPAPVSLQVYPNPTGSGLFHVLLPHPPVGEGKVDLTVMDTNGRPVWQQTVAAGSTNSPIAVSLPQLPEGVYLLKMTNAHGDTLTQRLIKG